MVINLDYYRKIQEHKKAIIFDKLLEYYKDLQDLNGVNIPYFIEAEAKYDEIIKTNKDVDYYYRKVKNEWKNKKENKLYELLQVRKIS